MHSNNDNHLLLVSANKGKAPQPAADDKQQRTNDTTSSSAAACPVANTTSRSTNTTSPDDDDDEEDSDEEIGAMIYASSKTASARRVAAEAAPMNNSQSSSSYEPHSEVRKRKSLSDSSSNSKEMESAVKKKRVTKAFGQRIEDLRAYKEKQGHTNVKKSEDKSLHDFCYNIRHARNHPEKSKTIITDDRIASLNALGFDWAVRKHSFAQRIHDLRAYKEEHGHVNVSQSEDKSLYYFCKDIRYARKNPEKSTRSLTDDRIASLDALGFDWRMS